MKSRRYALVLWLIAATTSACTADTIAKKSEESGVPRATMPCLALGDRAETPTESRWTPNRLQTLWAMLEKRSAVPLDPQEITAWGAANEVAEPVSGAVLLVFMTASVTFYKDTLPELETRGWKAVLAVKTDEVGAANRMSWAQLKDAASRGVVLAGSGKSVVDLGALSDQELHAHTAGVRATMAANGVATAVFVYPRPGWRKRETAAVLAAGYKVAIGPHTADLGGGAYAAMHPSRALSLGCALPVLTTEDDALATYLDNSRIEAEDVFSVQDDPPTLDRIGRGNSNNDTYAHIYMADKGDVITVPIYFPRAGPHHIRTRIKSGVADDAQKTTADYRYTLDGDALTYSPEDGTTPENQNITWGHHKLTPVNLAKAGWRQLELKCLQNWSCLLDWIEVRAQ